MGNTKKSSKLPKEGLKMSEKQSFSEHPQKLKISGNSETKGFRVTPKSKILDELKTFQKSKNKKLVINFGKFHEYAQTGDEIETAHELAEEERKLLIEDFKNINKIEKEEEAELKAIKHFEKKLQDLIENVVYLEGYIEEIKDGHSMLKVNPSVKELGNKLADNINEVEKLSESMLDEEKKVLGLAKHVKQILSKAKQYQNIIFG